MVRLGSYELLRPIGRGGMADVYLALRRGPGGVEKRVVVKRVRRERAADARFLRLFVEEARLSMSLTHQNLVAVFDFGRAGDELFLVMEHVDGPDLGAALARAREIGSPPSPLLAAFVALEACRGLSHAHRVAGDRPGVVHRDVTPRNLLLSRAGEVKLADFGVALQVTDVGAGETLRGTPAYMAPEQARQAAVDARADIFSLGLVLWEALSGRRAYGGDEGAAVLEQARRGEVGPVPAGVPDDLAAAVARATRAQPEARYQTAVELAGALDDFIVAARASAGGPAPSNLLATWIAELFPERARADPEAPVPPARGKVVTFLEDGADEIGATAGATASDATAAAGLGAPGGRRLLAGLAAAVVVAALAAIAARSMRSPPASPELDEVAEAPEVPVAAPAVAAAPAEIAAEAAAEAAEAAELPVEVAAEEGERPGASGSPAASGPPGASRRRRPVAGEAPPAPDPGQVRVSTRPWSRVEVRGHGASCAETPCTLTLPPGVYTLRLENPIASLGAEIVVRVDSGRTSTVVRDLREGD